MDFFKTYTSNTIAGSANQFYFTNQNPNDINIGRIFYKISCGGSFNYSILFSNVIDSTYGEGDLNTNNNFICDTWKIERLRVGVSENCDPNQIINMKNITFSGRNQKIVEPGEFFNTDPIELNIQKDEYLCVEISFCGRIIPYHEESIIPCYVLKNGQWEPSKKMPFPGMIGCDRPIKKRIGFLGDSITQGIGTEVNSYTHWNAVLSEKLDMQNAYWNLGIGYARAADAASNGAWMFKAKQNDIVFVCLGVNDMGRFGTEVIKENLCKVINILNDENIKVILQTIPPFDYSDEETIKSWVEVNEYIKTQLESKVELVFDNVPILQLDDKHPFNSKFGGHPNQDGCLEWAEELYRVVRTHL